MEAMFKIAHAKKWLLVSEFMAHYSHIQEQKPYFKFQWWMNKTLKLTTPFISSPITDICNK